MIRLTRPAQSVILCAVAAAMLVTAGCSSGSASPPPSTPASTAANDQVVTVAQIEAAAKMSDPAAEALKLCKVIFPPTPAFGGASAPNPNAVNTDTKGLACGMKLTGPGTQAGSSVTWTISYPGNSGSTAVGLSHTNPGVDVASNADFTIKEQGYQTDGSKPNSAADQATYLNDALTRLSPN